MPIVVYGSDPGTYRRVWWPFAAWGVALVLFGLVLMLAPELTASLMVIVFGWVSLAAGVLQGVAAVTARRQLRGLALLPVIGAVVAVCIGLAALLFPEFVASVFVVLVGFAVLVWGVADTLVGWTGRRRLPTWGWHVLRGLLIALAGVFIVTRPLPAIIAASWVLGALAIATGLMTVTLALAARHPGER
jgi:uncharacterized membrane protein HdeD (DUF308 family)